MLLINNFDIVTKTEVSEIKRNKHYIQTLYPEGCSNWRTTKFLFLEMFVQELFFLLELFSIFMAFVFWSCCCPVPSPVLFAAG